MSAKSMKWSWPLARIAGIEVSVHLTFFLLLLWVAISVWQQTRTEVAVAQGILFVLVLFTCVVLHEFGHALTARRFGVETRGITLLPIGGVASMERMPENPRHEILVALAGPAVNLVIAGILGIWMGLAGVSLPEVEEKPLLLFTTPGAFLYNIMAINLVLAAFNLLPAFPMDGGRVLRGVLALFMSHHEATRKAASVGQFLAVGMFGLGLLYNPMLMLISVFIWLGATAEAGAEQLEHSLHDLLARDVMISRFETLADNDSLDTALDLALHSGQKYFPVRGAQGGAPRLLDQGTLLEILRSRPGHMRLGELELDTLRLVDANRPMRELMPDIGRAGNIIGVVENGELVGLVSLENLLEWLRFLQAREAGRERRAGQ